MLHRLHASLCHAFLVFLMVTLYTNYYPRMYQTDIHQIFRIDADIGLWVQINDPTFFFSDGLRDVAMTTNLGPNRSNWPTLLHSLHWHSETDWNIATPMGAL